MTNTALAAIFAVLVLAAAPALAQQPSCTTGGGVTACGYGCTSAYGTAACASLPGGTCLAAYGTIGCGFSCVAAYGEVKCAQTQGGICEARTGTITCFDPPASPAIAAPTSPDLPVEKATCQSAGTATVCGFNCARAAGKVACSQTANGACGVVAGTITCNDPPPFFGNSPRFPKMACKAAAGTMACGYSCTVAAGTVKCAQTPQGICEARSGTITCFDPPSP